MKPPHKICPLAKLDKKILRRQRQQKTHGIQVLIEAMQKQKNEVF